VNEAAGVCEGFTPHKTPRCCTIEDLPAASAFVPDEAAAWNLEFLDKMPIDSRLNPSVGRTDYG